MPLRVATWNVNSIRARIELAARFIEGYQPDVLCLQETKVSDLLFPRAEFEHWGYSHIALSGAVGAPGVAILSRRPFAATSVREWCRRKDHRYLEARLDNGLELHNYYVPAGGDIPDPERNPKFAHKLQFLAEVAAWYRDRPGRDQPALLVGDLNVAPYQTDVWSHARLRNVITHTEVEIAALNAVREAFDWVDVMRRFVPEDQTLFTWWSYRGTTDWQAATPTDAPAGAPASAQRGKQGERGEQRGGRRLDHVWATPAASALCTAMEVVTEARGWPRPSDHVPVIVDLDLD
jgi:exodeoxyribonuclease-3